MGRAILHVDLDAFYASVAQRDDPRLQGRPVAVGPGVVLAASYEARARGLASGMAVRRALAMCPGLVVVTADFDVYLRDSRTVMEVCRSYTPRVEQISIDEAFLDVTGARAHFGSPERIASSIRADITAATSLPASVGSASTKFLAKVASRRAKPDGLVVVAAGCELEFLHPLPIDHIWGVGPVVGSRLASFGIVTVGDLAACPLPALESALGDATARHLHALAWNRDPREVRVHRSRGSVGAQSALGRRRRTRVELETILLRLADRVGRRLRAKGLVAGRLTLRVRYEDFASSTGTTGLGDPTAVTAVIHRAAVELLQPKLQPGRSVTLLGISVSSPDAGGGFSTGASLGFSRALPHTIPPDETGRRDRRGASQVRHGCGAVCLDRRLRGQAR